MSKHPAVKQFVENMSHVNRLVDIHSELTGGKSGNWKNIEVINKSAVVLLIAAWEAFIEDLALYAVNKVLNDAADIDCIPDSLVHGVCISIIKENKERTQKDRIIGMAGDGWKRLIKEHVEKKIDYFHTARVANVDELFQSVFGLKKISLNWYWSGCSITSAAERLDALIDIRGNIAHRVNTEDSVKKNYVKNSINLVVHLAEKTLTALDKHLTTKCKVSLFWA